MENLDLNNWPVEDRLGFVGSNLLPSSKRGGHVVERVDIIYENIQETKHFEHVLIKRVIWWTVYCVCKTFYTMYTYLIKLCFRILVRERQTIHPQNMPTAVVMLCFVVELYFVLKYIIKWWLYPYFACLNLTIISYVHFVSFPNPK